MFHVKHRAAVLGRVGVVASDAQLAKLTAYEELLRRVAVPKGMVARSDEGRLFERHIADAARGLPLLGAPSRALDLGSGAGLPGLPLAILDESLAWTLLEPRRQRAAFLELVQRDLDLRNVTVLMAKAEAAAGLTVGTIVARAFADPATTWDTAARLLEPDGRLLVWVGGRVRLGADAAAGAQVRLVTSPVAEMGPIAIMTRQ